MYKAIQSLEDCGTEVDWFRVYGMVQMVIKAPSGRTLALVNELRPNSTIKKPNPMATTDAQIEAIKIFMQNEQEVRP